MLTKLLFFQPLQQVGEMLDKGCEERCICRKGGKWSCEPRCQGALVQREKLKNLDPHCFERASNDECCSIVRCDDSADAEIIGGEFDCERKWREIYVRFCRVDF
jgi:hypothetical protein